MPGEIRAPQPGGEYVSVKAHQNHLVIFTEVHSSKWEYDDFRKTDVEEIVVDFHCFNCEGQAPPVRAKSNLPHVNSKVYRNGDLTLGYFQILEPKKGFKDGPQVITDPTEADVANAGAWWANVLQQRATSQVSGPSAPPAPPQASAWDTSPPPSNSGWGDLPPAVPAPPAPSPAPAAGPTKEQVQAMDLTAVQLLVGAGIITADQARACGHAV